MEDERLIHPKGWVRTQPATGMRIAICRAYEDLTGKGDKRAEIFEVKYLYIKVRFIGVFTAFIFSRFSLMLDLVLHFPIYIDF